MNLHSLPRLAPAWICFVLLQSAASAQPLPKTTPAEGLRENTPTVHALVGARIVVAPGRTIDSGTVVIRDGLIEAVGADLQPPADARVWDIAGKTIYAGLLDAYGEVSVDGGDNSAGAGYWNDNVTPQRRVDAAYKPDARLNRTLRSQGITARLVAPSDGIIKGTSALVTTGDEPGNTAILNDKAALHAQLTVSRERRRGVYPNSPMGALTLVRQAFYDADWYRQAWHAYRAKSSLPRPEVNEALQALQDYTAEKLPIVIDAQDELYFLRADQVAGEFGLNIIVRGSGREYRRLDAIRATGRPVIVPVNFSKAPDVRTPEGARAATLESLLHWDLAPENPGRLAGAGVRIALTSHGLDERNTYLAAVRKAVRRGLDADDALKAMTTTPAAMLGVEDRLGTVEPGKIACLVVVDGGLFDKDAKVLETWVAGKRYEIVTPPLLDVRGTWEVDIADDELDAVSIELTGKPERLSGKLRRGERHAELKHVDLDAAQLSFTAKGEPLGREGMVRISATVTRDENEATWLGQVAWPDGTTTVCRARRTSTPDEAAAAVDTPEDETADDENDKSDEEEKPAEKEKPQEPDKSLYDVNFPLGARGRGEPPELPAAVVFRGATVWTCGPEGVLENASVLVERGRITAVGTDVAIPDGATVIDATGKHITPGIIDCHSHIATDGGVNESGQAITAEVRIGDFINPNDINIYRQMAGGVTASNILHGSANPIGGQNQVIKMRWGALPEEMKFAAAPPGIKFALGENVKQSNWGERYTTRYPQSRMGVEQIIQEEFNAARDYQRAWDAWRRQRAGLPPRVDLELEAIVEILDGKRLIHCHSYRQDEILALLRTCEAFGVRIASLQHILEGYKVADAMREHGAGGSSFSDWWAYKVEVFDAIPYNGALMHDVGILVSFNSDDAELGRRLNLEAAKAVKYGAVDPAEALKFVTLNPARQLGIDGYVGSLEPGKEADLVVWSGSPLSTYSMCEQTWIDGRKYFDRQEDADARQRDTAMHAALVQRVLVSGAPVRKPGEEEDDMVLWPDEDIFCHHGDGHDHH